MDSETGEQTGNCKFQEVEKFGVDIHYIKNILKPIYRKSGIDIIRTGKLQACDVRKIPSTWAKKLSMNSKREFFEISAKIRK